MITKGLYTSQYVGMSDPTIKCTFEWDMYSEGSTRLNDDQILVHLLMGTRLTLLFKRQFKDFNVQSTSLSDGN